MERTDTTRCPRCGQMTLLKPFVINALSRYRDEFICSDCGTQEALEGFLGLPQTQWYIDINGGDNLCKDN